MANFSIFYRNEPNFCENNLLNSSAPWHEKREYILDNYTQLGSYSAEDLNEVYDHYQAENWSPNGEARGLISSLGLTHTSMSVGDLIYSSEERKLFEVASCGFNEIHAGEIN